jgi:hypothetical protein
MQPLGKTIILLMGFAGTGKYTIGRELTNLTGAKLIDNHLINNSLFTALNADGVTPLPFEIWDKVGRVRSIVYETIRELSPPELSFIFTMQLMEDDPRDQQAFVDLQQLSADRESLFAPFRLVCDVEELCRRVVNPARAERLKQIDSDSARRRALTRQVLNPTHPHVRTLDVTSLTAIESATQIRNEIEIMKERDR